MSKTIKVIDLLNMIDNGEIPPKQIEVDGRDFTWDMEHFYKDYQTGNDLCELSNIYNTYDFLQLNVLIISPKTEEQPEIDIQSIKEVGIEDIANIDGYAPERMKNKINQLIKAVKQLDNQINNK